MSLGWQSRVPPLVAANAGQQNGLVVRRGAAQGGRYSRTICEGAGVISSP
jgi:hypothetical protein